MRIPSAATARYIYFVAVDATDLKTRETGLAAKFVVYRSRDGGAAAVYTTPTINETDSTNMPGVYELLIDEDTTIANGSYSEEYALHIRDTGARMSPVTRVIELFRTHVVDFSDTGVNERLARIQSDVDTGIRVHIDDSDTGLKDVIADLDTGLRGILQTTGVNVTKLVGDTGAANWLKSVYANGFTDTGLYSRIDKLSEDTGGVNINSIQGDTGAAGWLKAAFANGFNDTGVTNRFDRLQFEVDTGLRAHMDDSDTGIKDAIADLDTGIRALLALRDTGAIATAVWAGDTGLRDHIDNTDTGLRARINTLAEDTGGVNINSIAGDTGAAAHLAQAFAAQNTNSDTGLIQNAATIRAKTDSLTFTVAGQVDSNIQSVNDTTVSGTGSSANPWGP